MSFVHDLRELAYLSGCVVIMSVDTHTLNDQELRLAVSVMLGASVYVAYLWLMRRELFYEIRKLIGGR